jgi:hypothetical protein
MGGCMDRSRNGGAQRPSNQLSRPKSKNLAAGCEMWQIVKAEAEVGGGGTPEMSILACDIWMKNCS